MKTCFLTAADQVSGALVLTLLQQVLPEQDAYCKKLEEHDKLIIVAAQYVITAHLVTLR